MTLDETTRLTLASYAAGMDAYLAGSARGVAPSHRKFLREVCGLLPGGVRILELGSGPGDDAAFFEAAGFDVDRTDGSVEFVDRLVATGSSARVLEIVTGSFGGPYDAVFANAVLLHLTRDQLVSVLTKVSGALVPGGLFAFTVKEGDGEAWSSAKLGRPRFFCYWREPSLRALLAAFDDVEVRRVQGRIEPWLQVTCRTPRPA